jgi:hypothetical protein
MIASEAHDWLKEVIRDRFPARPRRRRRFHLAHDALANVHRVAMRTEVGAIPRAVFRRPGLGRGRAAVGPGGGEVPQHGPEAGRVAGCQRAESAPILL